MACPARRSAVDLVGRLAHAQLAQDGAGETCSAPGIAAAPQDLLGPHPVGDTHAGRGAVQRIPDVSDGHPERFVRLCVRDDLDDRAGTTRLGRELFEQWYDEDWFAVRRHGQTGQTFERQGVVADEVAEVRSRRQQQNVDVRPPCRLSRTLQPRAEHVRSGHPLRLSASARHPRDRALAGHAAELDPDERDIVARRCLEDVMPRVGVDTHEVLAVRQAGDVKALTAG